MSNHITPWFQVIGCRQINGVNHLSVKCTDGRRYRIPMNKNCRVYIDDSHETITHIDFGKFYRAEMKNNVIMNLQRGLRI